MSGTLSSIEAIQAAAKFDTSEYSTVSTLGSFINNDDFARGFIDFQNGNNDTSKAFIYNVISAVGDQIGDTVYSNVKNYIDFVSNVDLCKVRALRSMFQMLGFDNTILDCIDSLPLEIVNLLDILSIDKNRLLKTRIMSDGFIDHVVEDGTTLAQSQIKLNLQQVFQHGMLKIDFRCPCAYDKNPTSQLRLSKLQSPFKQMSYHDRDGMLSSLESSIAGALYDASGLSGEYRDLSASSIAYLNDYGYLALQTKANLVIADQNKLPFMVFPPELVNSLTTEAASAEINFEDLSAAASSSLCCDMSLIESKLSVGSFAESDSVRLTYLNEAFKDDLAVIDDASYESLVVDIFETLISSILTTRYNADFTRYGNKTNIYVYPYLGQQYYDQLDYAFNGSELDPYDEQIKSVKLLNHVQKSFNQKAIVDAIDVGDDSLDNYSGAELSVLDIEMKRRKTSLSLEKIGLEQSSFSNSSLNSTRYSYYREKKVLEYAKFVDNYFASISQSGNTYDYDPNYYKVDTINVPSNVLSLKGGIDNPNPDVDINFKMVSSVARYLAKLARYINKLREKIKLQTRKNYMKGTNLLLIYIINEWLIDYSRHNSSKFLGNSDTSAAFSTVFASLSNHQFTTVPGTYTIGVDENYDQTEYFNLSTSTTPLAQLSSETSPRFWEQTTIENPEVLGGDGLQYTLAQIQNFYLSVLNLDQPLKDSNSNLTEFLSSLYDLGANDSFVYSTGDARQSIFASRLSSGELATDLYPHLVSLSSNWDSFMQYLSGDQQYQWTTQTVEGQISSVLNEKIYKELSDQYLSGVSAVYFNHISAVESLSSNIDQLSTEYVNFLTGDYSFYFKKFENSKCCYQDLDLENAIYLCPYYVGNPDVDTDDMTLHQHLYELDKWCTDDNIKNWSLLCTVSYVRQNVTSLSDELGKITESNDFQNKYGFVDINALTFDAELNYVYKFLDDNITSRKEFLQKQIDTVRQQVASCKTAYESLNNTFTAAVAAFDDNHPGYKLGDSEVRWFSTYEDSGDLARAKRQTKKPTNKKWEYVVYVPEAGIECWYYGKSDMDGDYLTDTTSITPYSQDDPLEARVAAVREYMNAPTLMTNDDDENLRAIYGLMNDGIVAVCDNVESSLKDLEMQYQTIADLAKEVLNVVVDGSAIGLYDRIVELNKAVANIDETVLDRDQTIKDYRNYIKQIISLSAQYLPVKQLFDGIFTDTEQSTYLFDLIGQNDLTFENLDNIDRFRRRKDSNNLKLIKAKTKEFLVDRFNQLVTQKNDLEVAIAQDDVQLKPTSGVNIELHVAQIQQALLDDVTSKTQRANYQIWLVKQRINRHIDVISSEVSSSLSDMTYLDQCVSARLSVLNFFESGTYQDYQKLFMTYGGRDFCWDPYYNIKNQTHPTYQVHPYLWNVVKKMNGQSLLESGFKSTVVDELEDMNFSSNASKYFGDFGQTINTWRASSNGLVDWSGYLSRYERSSNTTASGIMNEVVDYDGLFYPPAVKQFSENPTQCISTVRRRSTRSTIAATINQSIRSKHLSSYFGSTEEGMISSVDVLQQEAISQISSYIEVNELSIKLSGRFVGQSLSSITKSSFTTVLDDSIPQTFYGKYYAHLQLPNSECQRVADQLEEYGRIIIDELVAVQHYTNEQDIYKYGLDINGNSYVLLKKYDYSQVSRKDQLTYQMKKNTLGELWIRLAGHPIAFPAFYGKHPIYFTKRKDRLNPSILHLAELRNGVEYADKERQSITQITDRMQWFYDFEMTQNKSNIFLISYNADLGLKHQKFWQRSEFSWVIPNVVTHYYDQNADIEYLTFSNTVGSYSNGYSTVKERIDFAADSEYAFRDQVDNSGNPVGLRWSLDPQEILKNGTQFPCLIGYFVDDMAAAEFVYLIKKFSNNGFGQIQDGINQSPQIFIVKVKSGTSFRKTPSTSDWLSINLGSRVLTSGNACIGFDLESMQLTIAFTTRAATAKDPSLSSWFSASTTSCDIDLDKAPDGAVFDDPVATEMNSHDALVENITLVDFIRSNATLQQKKVHDHNLNADMSYLPSYPGLSNEMRIFSNDAIQKNDYYAVELLGMSKDLSYSEKLVNPNPNPYLDYDTISEDGMFGRVYEDYIADYDKTYKLIKAPALNDNMVKNVGNQLDLDVFSYDLSGRSLGYTLAVHLDQLYDLVQYSERDYDNLQVLIYNSKTLGKNPYAIAHLTSFLEERELYYTKIDATSSSDEYKLSTEAIGSQNSVIVTGTREAIGKHSKIDSNYIRNISKILCRFSRQQKMLVLTFMIEDPSTPTSIDEDTINILLFNPNDLTQFKYYHLLDAYGAVNCRYISSFADPSQPDDGRGWGVIYDHSKFENDDLSSLLQSYYIDKDSGDKKKLADIELSDYQALSDVYCLRGNKMLGFKYDEELHFAVSSDLYYFPSLNVSYPKSAVDCITRMGITKQEEADLGYLQTLFNKHNLFVVTLDRADDVAKNIGSVDIPILLDNTNDIRMYEDWLDDDLSTGLPNSQTIGITDPRAMQFAKFHDNGNDQDGIAGPLVFEPSAFENVSLEDFIQNCQDLSNASPCKSEEYDPTKDPFGSLDKIQVDLSRGTEICEQLQKLLRIYASYKKDTDDHSITLYFNYFNYFDTPYIKIENQLLYSDMIQGTYLKLKAGEDGILDIVLQLRYCIGNEIYGYRNIKALSYRIWNLSDDKPKFLIRKTYEIQKDSLANEDIQSTLFISTPNVEVNLDQNHSDDSKIDITVPLDLASVRMLSSELEMTVLYPPDIIQMIDGENVGYTIEEIDNEVGFAVLKITNTTLNAYQLRFQTTQAKQDFNILQDQECSLDITDIRAFDIDGVPLDTVVECGSIRFVKNSAQILGTYPSKDITEEKPQRAIIADMLSSLILV